MLLGAYVITTFIYIGSNILFPNLSVFADDLDYYDIIDWRAHYESMAEVTLECMAEATFNQFTASITTNVQHDRTQCEFSYSTRVYKMNMKEDSNGKFFHINADLQSESA